MATAFRTLAERDTTIVETVQEQIREHSELIARETARISEAMEAYVQQGVQAMAQLAGRADSSVESFSNRDEEVSDRIRQIVEQQMSELGEQMQLLYDRTAIAATSLHELVASLGDRMSIESREAGSETRDAVMDAARQMNDATRERRAGCGSHGSHRRQPDDRRTGDGPGATRSSGLGGDPRGVVRRTAAVDEGLAAATAVNRTIEERVMGLAQLVRADSEAIREELVRRTAAVDAGLAAALDERLSGVTDQTLEVIDRNMIRMVDALEAHFERLSAQVGERAATSVDLAIGARFDDVLARLHASAEVIERGGSEVRTVLDERLAGWDERFASLDERIAAWDDRFASLDGRFAALAKLTRSDSEALASQILADQEVTKQALRAMKELQASLPAEVIQMVEQRFASVAESIERSNEMLAHRIDRMAESLGQRQNDDIQIVIDRMGDAMHALASFGKAGPEASKASAIEID